jgi:hypothetical protein
MKRKWLAVGIILLFVGTYIIPTIAQDTQKSQQTVVDSGFQIIIIKPENGIYINDYKILPFCVPLVLWRDITVELVALNGSGLVWIEFFINGLLKETITGSDSWRMSCGPFSKLNIKTMGYSKDEFGNIESDSDEIVIWRLIGGETIFTVTVEGIGD